VNALPGQQYDEELRALLERVEPGGREHRASERLGPPDVLDCEGIGLVRPGAERERVQAATASGPSRRKRHLPHRPRPLAGLASIVRAARHASHAADGRARRPPSATIRFAARGSPASATLAPLSDDFLSFLLDALPKAPARVLEVGCGAGGLARAVADAGHRVLAIDPEAPEGPIFRRTTLEQLDDRGPFDAVVAQLSLHHVHDLDAALDRVVGLLAPGGALVLDEFGWDLVDERTAGWWAERSRSGPGDAVLADWRAEHEGLHGYGELRRALDGRLSERHFAWRPFLHDAYRRPDLEAAERQAIERGDIAAVGFRYAGAPR
jgi:SAM-dependent methyltransferase